jgi:glycosyltransferase involved in cell wall biosynthesis
MENRTLKSRDIISVIISAYNSHPTIRGTLASLENQNLDKTLYEVIVMDDGSQTSETWDIVQEFINRWIMNVYYFYQKNAWVGIARNAGIAESVGKILAFTDADCICDKSWLSVIQRSLVIEEKHFIWWDTYSDDTVIFPWKMAPVGQSGITANMAVDFMLIDGILFDSGFTGMLGDDTDFVLRMEENWFPLVFVPDMKVLHPPNILALKRVIIRARGRHNEVWLYKKHWEKVLASFSYIFRPLILGRISPFSLIFLFVLIALIATVFLFWFTGLFASLVLFMVSFYTILYRFFVIYNPDNRPISLLDRTKTLLFFAIVAPLFIYYRIVWSIKFHFFML